MLVGHIGAAMIAKQAAPRVSLGMLLLASLLADVVLFTLLLTGTEAVQFRTSVEPAAYYAPLKIVFSHSLATTVIAGATAALIYAWRTRQVWGAAILGLTVLSHWLLDLFTHPVLPVWSIGRPIYAGSTLARWITLVMILEAAIWIAALFLYVRDSRSVNAAGRYAFWGGVVSWTWIWWANLAGPPRTPSDAPIEMLIVLGLLVVWGYWMNRVRRVTASPFSEPEHQPS